MTLRQAQGKDVLMYSDLITSLKTTEEVDDFSLEIDKLLSTIFKSEKMSLDKAVGSISNHPAKKIMDIFSKNSLDSSNKEMVSDFLQTLKDLIQKLKVIKLILAFDPTFKTIENIHDFVSKNIGAGYVLDIEKDEALIGGAIVIFNGKYKDYSLRKTLEEAFANKKGEILKLIQ